jgi:hypothetical protein
VPEAARRGAVIDQETAAGCWFIAGSPVTANGAVLPWAQACVDYRPVWLATVAAAPGDTVLWLSTFDAARRMIDGTVVDPATPDGRKRIADLIVETANVVAPPGSARRVVFFLPVSHAPSELHPVPDPESAIVIQHHRAILHLVVASDPTRFSMLDLGEFLCPRGPPCPAQPVPGVTPRGHDGGHLTPEGTAWLAPQVLDALGVT